ncbi:type II toxin-antitoxin system prevent-host-death family antitoxin [Sphingomonas panacis]|nr:type II toxin-antitoxin system prevent-host-death family antitoxin [Sphingomonas panacis]
MFENAMTVETPLARTTRDQVPLTTFHNHTGQYLDLGRRTPVTITKHGRPDITIAEASYFDRIERIAAGQILAVLDLKAVDAADMTDEHAALFEAARPTPEEIAADRWNDDAAS